MLIQDTFRGRVCECPMVDGVQFKGDGYSSCKREFNVYLPNIYLLNYACPPLLCFGFIHTSPYLQQVDQADANWIMEAVGMKLEMDIVILLVWSVHLQIFFPIIILVETQFIFKFLICSQQDDEEGKCTCPPGFKGDGKSCQGKRFCSLGLFFEVHCFRKFIMF